MTTGEQARQQRQQWLDGLKVGDEVATPNRGYAQVATILKVVRMTNTQLVTNDGQKWRRKDGGLVGGSFTALREVTPEVRERIVAAENRSRLSGICYPRCEKLTDAEVAAMLGAYDSVHVEQEKV